MKIALRLLPLATAGLMLASCQNGKSGSSSSSSDPYVSNYGSDGGYNPYPGQTGYAQGGGSSAAPTYTQAPAPAPSDPYAFSAPSSSSSSSPKPTYSTPPRSSASSGSSSTTKKKTVASSPKPKPKTSSTAKSSGSSRKASSHKVTSGDSLYAIALKNKTSVAKLKAANKLSTDLIKPGQVLKIP